MLAGGAQAGGTIQDKSLKGRKAWPRFRKLEWDVRYQTTVIQVYLDHLGSTEL
jgi:hypothetical protein